MPDRAVVLYDEALGLWRGDPFGELTCEWWALPESSRLQVMRTSAELGRAAGQIALGHHHRAIADLERLTREHPHDERAVTLLMNALRQTGRSAEALRVGRSFRQRLAEDTGLDPSPGLSALETAVVAGADPASDVGRPLRGYTIHHAIGEGAHGRVYAGTQPGTDRPVAIKAIRPDIADSNPFIVRFEAEARLVARLEHPHIVPLYDFWREPGGAYLVFRLLSGGTAKESVVSGGQWSLPRVSRLVEEVGGALIAAHAAGVVHHDVTTSNVFLDEDGAAYLGDFGIATSDGRFGRRPRRRRRRCPRLRVSAVGAVDRLGRHSRACTRRQPGGPRLGSTTRTRRCAATGRRRVTTPASPSWCSAGGPRPTALAPGRRSRPASGWRSTRNDAGKRNSSLGRRPPAPTRTAACARSTRPPRRIFTGDDVQ